MSTPQAIKNFIGLSINAFVLLGPVACSNTVILESSEASTRTDGANAQGQSTPLASAPLGASGQAPAPLKPTLFEKQEYSQPVSDTTQLPGAAVPSENLENQVTAPTPTKELADEKTSGAPANVPLQKSEVPVPEDTAIDPPMEISGAFLTCTKTDGLYCALDKAVGQKFNFTASPSVALSVELNNSLTQVPVNWTYQPTTSRWHWKINSTTFTLDTVTKVWLKLPPSINRGAVYQTSFLLTPIRIGDGTNRGTQGGCSQPTYTKAVYAGATFKKTFTLGQTLQNLQINFIRLCGIVRPMDSFVRLTKGTQVMGTAFLPGTTGENDFHIEFKDLSAGGYTVEAVPGNDIDVDDFMFYDLRLSY